MLTMRACACGLRGGALDVVGKRGPNLDAVDRVTGQAQYTNDIELPGMLVARTLRSHDAGRSVPILMVTTRSLREDIVAAVEAGVNSYIVKPFTPQVLKEKIDQLLAAPAVGAS